MLTAATGEEGLTALEPFNPVALRPVLKLAATLRKEPRIRNYTATCIWGRMQCFAN